MDYVTSISAILYFPAVLNFMKKHRNIHMTLNLALIIFKQCLAKCIRCILDFQNRLPVTSNQNLRQSPQTGNEIISQQLFDALTPNLVYVLRTLFWWCIHVLLCVVWPAGLLGPLIAACSYIYVCCTLGGGSTAVQLATGKRVLLVSYYRVRLTFNRLYGQDKGGPQ